MQDTNNETAISFEESFTSKLLKFTDAVHKEATKEGSRGEKMQSIIGVVYTLMAFGRTDDLYQALKTAFPEYYDHQLSII